jgi:hypothetical protein
MTLSIIRSFKLVIIAGHTIFWPLAGLWRRRLIEAEGGPFRFRWESHHAQCHLGIAQGLAKPYTMMKYLLLLLLLLLECK